MLIKQFDEKETKMKKIKLEKNYNAMQEIRLACQIIRLLLQICSTTKCIK